MLFTKDAMLLLISLLLIYFCNTGNSGSISPTKLTPSEKQAVEKFRPMVKEVLYRDYMEEDYYLIRFLRAKEMQLGEAAQMVKTAHKWRLDNKIDGIMNEDTRKVQKLFKYYSDGVDFEGRPVITWDYGKWDIRRMSVSGSMDQLVRHLDRILEEGFIKVREQRNVTAKDVTQFVMIIDGYGFSVRTHSCLTCLPFYYAFITHNDMYYPQAAHRVYMINVPRVFSSVLDIIRPIMATQTRDTLKIYGFDSTEWRTELRNNIPTDQIRKQFGGTRSRD